jgi:surface polysaccharide O-acyltransferase-like enzyme
MDIIFKIGIGFVIIPIILLIIGLVNNDSLIQNLGIFIFILYVIIGTYIYISSRKWMIQHKFREI